ncbi:MAG: UbiD family decarboxylase, partial [Desulfobacterales bacterium]|nr:UbiD family decarboxylase [Desulfobacterales bacterium]
LREARIKVKDVKCTPGASGFFHAIISIEAKPGDGNIALMTALTTHIKHAVVVDDDVDIQNPMEVEWAIATRVQADKDVVIVRNLSAKPLDPSLDVVTGTLPTTAKMGIDATMPAHLPRERFARIKYLMEDELDVSHILNDDTAMSETAEEADITQLANDIEQLLSGNDPLYYSEIVKQYWTLGLQNVGQALSILHGKGVLWKDHLGRLCLRDSAHAAEPPTSKFTS